MKKMLSMFMLIIMAYGFTYSSNSNGINSSCENVVSKKAINKLLENDELGFHPLMFMTISFK